MSQPAPSIDPELRYRSLLDAASAIFKVETLEDLVQLVLVHSLAMMQAEACSLYLPSDERSELTIYSARGQQDAAVHQARIPVNKGIAGRVFRTRQPVNLANAADDPDFYRTIDQNSGFRTRSMLCLPLLDNADCLGVLQALNPLHTPAFSMQDHRIFEGLGVIVTSVLQRLQRDRHARSIARLEGELDAARDIQRNLLPPDEADFDGAQVRVKFQAARYISGDFYVTQPLKDGSLLIALGDVSGKGVPAALTAAQVLSEISLLFQQAAPQQRWNTGALPRLIDGLPATAPLAMWVEELNKRLCKRLLAGRFIAATFLRYCPITNIVEIVRAGQFSPLRGSGKSWVEEAAPAHLPLGVSCNQTFHNHHTATQPGEHWLLFSDGIAEARNTQGEEFQMQRIHEALAKPNGAPVELLWRDWLEFSSGRPLHDDACLVGLRCLPPSKVTLSSDAKCCRVGRRFVEDWATVAGYDEREIGEIVLAADEAFTNCIRHAYNGRPGLPIVLVASCDNEEFRLHLEHHGTHCDMGALEARAIEEIRPGGLGLHLIRRVFSRIESERTPEGTRITLARPLPLAASR